MRARRFVAPGLLRVAAGTPNIYALFASGTSLLLARYLNDAFLGAVASFVTTAAEPASQQGTWIQSDPLGFVSSSSYVFWGEKADTSSSVVVCDIRNGVEYTYDAAVGATIFGLMQSQTDGYLYWLEFEENTGSPGNYDVTIKKAKTNLTSVSTVGASALETIYPSHVAEFYSSAAILFTNIFSDGETWHYAIHRVSTAGAFSHYGPIEIPPQYRNIGYGIPVTGSAADSFGARAGETYGDETNGYACDTGAATPSYATVQKINTAAIGLARCFSADGSRVLLANGADVQVYSYGDTAAAPLVDATLGEPLGTGFSISDLFDVVIP